MSGEQRSSETGTRNEIYDVVSVLYHALKGAENCEKYCDDTTEEDLRGFFEQAIESQRQLADRAKQLLGRRLQGGGETPGGANAFFQQNGEGRSRSDDEDEVPAAGSAS